MKVMTSTNALQGTDYESAGIGSPVLSVHLWPELTAWVYQSAKYQP